MLKKVLKIIIIVISVLLVLAAALYGYYRLFMDPYRGTVNNFETSAALDTVLSKEQAEEDLSYLMEQLRSRHPAWLDGSGKDSLAEEQYKKELTALGDEVSVIELYGSASRITASLHDGHTGVQWIGNGQYVDDFSVIENYGKPLTIDGIPSEDVLKSYMEVCSYDLDFYAEARFWSSGIISESVLMLCGIDTSDGVEMTFDSEGVEKVHSFEFVPIQEVSGYQQNSGESNWVYYEIDKENSVGIFKLTSCICNDEYLSTLDSFFEEVFAQDIENVIVDLRGNGGGNSRVADEFIRYLDVDEYKSWDSAVRYGWLLVKNEDIVVKNKKHDAVFDGEVFVLTDVWTYSAAMDFAMLITDNDLGTIVGQPSGNNPDSYGDCLFFRLPNSGLSLSVSYKKWYRVDREKSGEPIMPDVSVDSEAALETAYELIKNQ